MTFKELAELTKDGAVLTAVQESQIENPDKYGDPTCNVFSFCLDGKTYSAVEDPSDGYRSYCSDLEVKDEPLPKAFECHVKGRMVEDTSWETNDYIQLVDVETNKVVLECGTGNTEDYYPFCVQRFDPRLMAVNRDR